MAKFSYKIEERPEALKITLSGVIDADLSINPLAAEEQRSVIFDFDAITGINSTGIRNWAEFLTNSQIEEKAVVFRNCRPAIIDQINISNIFRPKHAQIESFYLDFVCDNCECEKEILCQTSGFDPTEIPTPVCDRCSNKMEFDGDEEFDFLFLNRGGRA